MEIVREDSIKTAKKAAATKAIDFIEDGMLIGLGSGSTSLFFVELLGIKCKKGLKIQAIPSSQESEKQALISGVPLIDSSSVTSLDLTFDGADEIDSLKRLIKGGGGSLTREKIVASMSKEMIVMIDYTKQVDQLGKFPLPVEILPFAHAATMEKMEKKGYRPLIRQKDSFPYITDNGNFIVDIHFEKAYTNPEEHYFTLRAIPGVVEVGFFFNLAGRVIVGQADGTTTILY